MTVSSSRLLAYQLVISCPTMIPQPILCRLTFGTWPADTRAWPGKVYPTARASWCLAMVLEQGSSAPTEERGNQYHVTPWNESFAALDGSVQTGVPLTLNLCTAAGMRGSLLMALPMALECTQQLRGRSTAESIC